MSDAVLDPWLVAAPPRRRTHAKAGSTGPLLVASILLMVLLAAGWLVARSMPAEAPSLPSPQVPVSPRWVDIQTPTPLYDLDASALSGLPRTYSARRRSVGGGREDALAFGTIGGPGPALDLKIQRYGTEPITPPPFYAVVARRAAEAGLSVGRVGSPDLMPTRFGAFEIADVALSAGVDGKPIACHGFRLAIDRQRLSFSGLACGGAHALPRGQIGCLLERLDLVPGGEDRALIDFFAASELRRDNGCAGRLSPDKRPADWSQTDEPRGTAPAPQPRRRRHSRAH